MIGPSPICIVCKHLHDSNESFVCDAFPDGIPSVILLNGVDHREPHDGDSGIQFEVRDGVASDKLSDVTANAFHLGHRDA